MVSGVNSNTFKVNISNIFVNFGEWNYRRLCLDQQSWMTLKNGKYSFSGKHGENTWWTVQHRHTLSPRIQWGRGTASGDSTATWERLRRSLVGKLYNRFPSFRILLSLKYFKYIDVEEAENSGLFQTHLTIYPVFPSKDCASTRVWENIL